MRSWQAGESKEMNWETEKRKRMVIRAMGRGKIQGTICPLGFLPPLPPSLSIPSILSPYSSVLPLHPSPPSSPFLPAALAPPPAVSIFLSPSSHPSLPLLPLPLLSLLSCFPFNIYLSSGPLCARHSAEARGGHSQRIRDGVGPCGYQTLVAQTPAQICASSVPSARPRQGPVGRL